MPPVNDLGLIDRVTRGVSWLKARRVAGGAIDVDHPVAVAADEMVVIVADPGLIPGRRPGQFDPPDDPLPRQHRQGIVDRLQGDRTYLLPYLRGDLRHRAVRLIA